LFHYFKKYDVVNISFLESFYMGKKIQLYSFVVCLYRDIAVPCACKYILTRVPAIDNLHSTQTVIFFELHHQLAEFLCHPACFFGHVCCAFLYGLSDDPSYPSPTLPCLADATVLMYGSSPSSLYDALLSYHIVLEDFVLLFGRTHLIHLNSNEKIN
jgi:hypothetical protein